MKKRPITYINGVRVEGSPLSPKERLAVLQKVRGSISKKRAEEMIKAVEKGRRDWDKKVLAMHAEVRSKTRR